MMALTAANPQIAILNSLSPCTDADKAGTNTYTEVEANGCVVSEI